MQSSIKQAKLDIQLSKSDMCDFQNKTQNPVWKTVRQPNRRFSSYDSKSWKRKKDKAPFLEYFPLTKVRVWKDM